MTLLREGIKPLTFTSRVKGMQAYSEFRIEISWSARRGNTSGNNELAAGEYPKPMSGNRRNRVGSLN